MFMYSTCIVHIMHFQGDRRCTAFLKILFVSSFIVCAATLLDLVAAGVQQSLQNKRVFSIAIRDNVEDFRAKSIIMIMIVAIIVMLVGFRFVTQYPPALQVRHSSSPLMALLEPCQYEAQDSSVAIGYSQ